MKHIRITPVVRHGFEKKSYKGWQISEVWGCYRPYQKGKDAPSGRNPLPWTLVHLPSQMWVMALDKREHCVLASQVLDEVGDWHDGVPTGWEAAQVFSDIRARCELWDAEAEMIRAKKEENREP